MFNKEDLIYYAGFFDGEGCVSCITGSSIPLPSVMIGNTDEKPIQELHKEFGGSRSNRKVKEGNKPFYDLFFSGKKVVPILEALLPFVRMKKRQVELGLALAALVGDSHAHVKVDERNELARWRLWEELQKINQRRQE